MSSERAGAADQRIECAWCGVTMRDAAPSAPVSHGICVGCLEAQGILPIEHLDSASPDLLDRLPFGVVQLAPDGRILAYSRGEAALSGLAAESVIGRNFFTDVAPCTNVREFRGVFAEAVAARRSLRREISFVFRFPHGAIGVSVVLLHDPAAGKTTLLAARIA